MSWAKMQLRKKGSGQCPASPVSQTALEMTNVVSAKTKWDEAAALQDEWERGFGTKKVASTERPGSDLGSVWHLLSGRAGWALRERVMWVGGVGRAPPRRQLRTERKGQVSWAAAGAGGGKDKSV